MGFEPKRPSRRVWFAESRRYAQGRAKTQARRSRDRPVVLTCDIDLLSMRERYGARRVLHRSNVIAIDGHVPVTVLKSYMADTDTPVTPTELAIWVNRLLNLRAHKGVGHRDPGILRLSQWMENRLNDQRTVKPGELVEMARRWLPEYFEHFEIDSKRLKAYRRAKRPGAQEQIETVEIDLILEGPPAEHTDCDPLESEALDCLLSDNPRRRARGLGLLSKIEGVDAFEWCVMCLDDSSVDVVVAALRAMRKCADGSPEAIMPLADSRDRQVRAAAVAALAKHADDDAAYWLARGLKDPEVCVRMEAVAVLPVLDPTEHRGVYELALYDPHPEVARRAEGLVEGKGYHRAVW